MHNTILNSEVFLDHIAIESTNPKKIAKFYSKNLMMKKNCVSDNEWHCFGPNRLLIFKKGINKKLSFAAFACKSERKLNKIRKRIKYKKFLVSMLITYNYEGFNIRNVFDFFRLSGELSPSIYAFKSTRIFGIDTNIYAPFFAVSTIIFKQFRTVLKFSLFKEFFS